MQSEAIAINSTEMPISHKVQKIAEIIVFWILRCMSR